MIDGFNNTQQHYLASDVQNMLQMQQYALKQQLDVNAEALKDGIRTANKMAVAEHKNQLALQRDIRRAELSEVNYRKRQLATRSVSENADGFLMMELISPDGRHSFSEPICPERYFRAKYFYAADSVSEENVLNIVWQGEEDGIFLLGKTMTAKAMGKAFLAKGIAFRIPRRVKSELMEQILVFLINNAEQIELPRCIGWTKNSSGVWVFETEETRTLEGMYHEQR